MAQRQTLPVLPLRGTVIFPGLTQPIAAGRPSTLRAIEAALKGDRLVFAVAQRDNTEEPTADILYSMGVIARIGQIQRGLGGVTFGNFLIKQVVEEISREFPRLSTFVTLSPVSGFRDWLNRERRSESPAALLPSDARALSHLDDPDWFKNADKVAEAKPVLSALAAHFFLIARTRGGRPIDPVARFHLGNGARL